MPASVILYVTVNCVHKCVKKLVKIFREIKVRLLWGNFFLSQRQLPVWIIRFQVHYEYVNKSFIQTYAVLPLSFQNVVCFYCIRICHIRYPPRMQGECSKLMLFAAMIDQYNYASDSSLGAYNWSRNTYGRR